MNEAIIDWGKLRPLRLRCNAIAEGLYSGQHRSWRKGSGIEFAGQRPYVQGDDLRFLNRKSLLRHDRWMIREFETDTERALWMCVDATTSMAYKENGPCSKLAYAAMIAGALARVAIQSGDPVGLEWFGGVHAMRLNARAGTDAFETLIRSLETIHAAGDFLSQNGSVSPLQSIARRSRSGSVIILLSDFLDLPDALMNELTILGSRKRALALVRILDPAEKFLPFEGALRLRATESNLMVETDIASIRSEYQANLQSIATNLQKKVSEVRGVFLDALTTDEPIHLVAKILQTIAELQI